MATPATRPAPPAAVPPPRTGIQTLSPEQVHAWTLVQKDTWWLQNVYRGNMPQLTLRSGITGMVIGAALSLPNLYIGAQTGWSLGFGVTSVIVSFGLFKVLSRLGIGREMTILENNAMQSIATAAGYMTAPLVSSLTAYMWQTKAVIPLWQTIVWMMSVSLLGVLFAFPLKKRFINDEQLPFPEGAAAGVVMEGLHAGGGKDGVFKAKLLAVTAGGAGLLKVLQSEAIMKALRLPFVLPDYLDGWIYRLVSPRVWDVPLRSIGVRWSFDFVMMATGGLMGIEAATSIFLGALLNSCLLVPWAVHHGDIHGKLVDGVLSYTFRDITTWALWTGVALLTTSSLVSFFSKPQVLVSSFRGLFDRSARPTEDPLRDIELPMSVFIIGIPVVGLFVASCAHFFFGVRFWLGLLAVPMVFVFSLIAANATGLTAITPSSALAKLTQITYGLLAPGNVATNLMTAAITSDVSLNASNLLMDIKPGYMLGAKPRHQAVGHVLGIIAGAVTAAPVFYLVFVQGNPGGMVSGRNAFPSATVWQAVAKALTEGLGSLPHSAKLGALCGAAAGITLELLKLVTKGRFWLSAVSVGLAFVIPFETSLAMFCGALIFWIGARLFRREGSLGHSIFVLNRETASAGIIAGGGLLGIVVIVIETFVLGGS
jgi:putative OPT family oligopeptide transporter